MKVQECTQNFHLKIGVVSVKMDLEAAEYESVDWIIMDIQQGQNFLKRQATVSLFRKNASVDTLLIQCEYSIRE